ncbi:hypothetical protein ACOSP7_014370 [Xanthoceras sorbifolium]
MLSGHIGKPGNYVLGGCNSKNGVGYDNARGGSSYNNRVKNVVSSVKNKKVLYRGRGSMFEILEDVSKETVEVNSKNLKSARKSTNKKEVFKDVTNKGEKDKEVTGNKKSIGTEKSKKRSAKFEVDKSRLTEHELEEPYALKQLHRDILAFNKGLKIQLFEEDDASQQASQNNMIAERSEAAIVKKIAVNDVVFEEIAS